MQNDVTPPKLPDTTDTPDQGSPTESFAQTLGRILLSFFGGLVIMTLIGLAAGAVFSGKLIADYADWGVVFNGFAVIVAVAPMTALFSIAAYVRRDWRLVFYPAAAFVVAGHLTDIDQGASWAKCVLVVGASYALVYAVGWSFFGFVQSQSLGIGFQRKRATAIYVSLLVLSVGAVQAVAFAVPRVQSAQQRSQAAIHLPNTSQLIAKPYLDYGPTRGLSLQKVDIYYKTATQQKDGKYAMADYLNVTQLADLHQKDTRQNCGAMPVDMAFVTQADPVTYKTTPGGVVYGERRLSKNLTIPPTPSLDYHGYHYCFVAGNYKYELVRTDGKGSAYLDLYPAVAVIDAVAQAPTYLPFCASDRPRFDGDIVSEPAYCTQAETQRIDQLVARASSS